MNNPYEFIPGTVYPAKFCDNISGYRPCQHTTCRFHLSQQDPSCTLDIAAEGEHTLEEVAGLMHLAPMQVFREEARALKKLRLRMVDYR